MVELITQKVGTRSPIMSKEGLADVSAARSSFLIAFHLGFFANSAPTLETPVSQSAMAGSMEATRSKAS
ncbi:hypothetical protein HMPREF9237_00462 [Actinotignum schaalii FB123-CNA-2]|uniref:Uncharacterized protein n=1 Tax=Actinotignum schaalii FB123-CNA-2 TaxID=883067 RepID=S2VM81_9ACTO|nr:hypothetical protein HMPREF9237_00462 [Actinotignum schaalii FB123-CNA-2]